MKIHNKIRFKLGENISNVKTLIERWLNELLKRSLIPQQYWQPAYSYGQMLNRQMPSLLMRANLSADQACQIGPSVQLNDNKSFVEREQPKDPRRTGKIGAGFSTIDYTRIKIRILNGLYTFWSNARLRWGMIMLLIIAPASKYIYLIFPKEGFGEYFLNLGPFKILNTIEGVDSWFYVTFYYYFSAVGELLAPVILIFGIFLLFPKKYYPSYLVGVPFGYYFGMLVHRMFFVGSNEEFYSGFASTVTLAFLLFGVILFMVSDKMLFRENHRKRATEARIIGLINMPGMEWNDKEPLIKKEVAEAMKIDNELFVKESA